VRSGDGGEFIVGLLLRNVDERHPDESARAATTLERVDLPLCCLIACSRIS
jgi:hypothetical protein